jgi:predicted cupin superfamily sugar epimerase
MNPRVESLIASLKLKAHPEGGFYRETYRSKKILDSDALGEDYPGSRAAVTAILYLLPTGARSAIHRVRSDEVWMHHQGDPVRLTIRKEVDSPPLREIRLGQAMDQEFQAVVEGGLWQEATALIGPAGYALVGCVVAPGFDFDDFEMHNP